MTLPSPRNHRDHCGQTKKQHGNGWQRSAVNAGVINEATGRWMKAGVNAIGRENTHKHPFAQQSLLTVDVAARST